MIPNLAFAATVPNDRNRMFKLDFGRDGKSSLEMLHLDLFRRYHAYLYRLAEVQWSVFGSLTWSDASRRLDTGRALSLRKEDFGQLLTRIKKEFAIRSRRLAYYQCTEWGRAEQCHYHFLIAQQGVEHVPPAELSARMESIWSRELGIGKAVVKPFDEARQLVGVSYCLKREHDQTGFERERYDNLSPVLLKRLKMGV